MKAGSKPAERWCETASAASTDVILPPRLGKLTPLRQNSADLQIPLFFQGSVSNPWRPSKIHFGSQGSSYLLLTIHRSYHTGHFRSECSLLQYSSPFTFHGQQGCQLVIPYLLANYFLVLGISFQFTAQLAGKKLSQILEKNLHAEDL
jgi:hypothetical protein